jgi:hypothetical protein
VAVLVSSPKPTHRIIQLRDWHYVPPELFALDVRQQVGRAVADEDVKKLYEIIFWRWSWFSLSRDSHWLTARPV